MNLGGETGQAAPDAPAASGRTVAVFDSGFGGLTVLRALLPRLPGTHFLYLGDTARLPYGAKSQATVARYAVEAARFLTAQGAAMLVIACNTATALALPEIRAAVNVPVVGVVEPGAQAALWAALGAAARTEYRGSPPAGEAETFLIGAGSTANSPRILVLATAATVASHAYRDACAQLGLQAVEVACPLLVPLVEEGWIHHPVTRQVLQIYLADALAGTSPAAVVLGCTHYPLLAEAITATLRELGCDAPVVDSADAAARAAEALWPHAAAGPEATAAASFQCYATDSVEKFARLGSHFLGQPIESVELLDLGG